MKGEHKQKPGQGHMNKHAGERRTAGAQGLNTLDMAICGPQTEQRMSARERLSVLDPLTRKIFCCQERETKIQMG